jgi:selenocysteine-specific elongation factor
MQDAPIVRVSARAKTGLDELLSTLTEILQEKPARLDLGRPRLPIDRVFSMSGFGTVVTGTLSDGHLAIGDEVIVLPSGHKGRVRGLQTHKKKEDRSVPGSRTAVNISGLAVEQITRGEVVTQPGQYQPTRRVDARIRLLKDVSQPIKHATEVKVFVGASETMAACACSAPRRSIPAKKAGSSSNYGIPWWPCVATATSCAVPRPEKPWAAA